MVYVAVNIGNEYNLHLFEPRTASLAGSPSPSMLLDYLKVCGIAGFAYQAALV